MPNKITAKRGFASDNNAGVHPKVLEAVVAANEGHVIAYGDDPYTETAKDLFRKHFGKEVEIYFVFGGTGANVLGLKAATRSHNAIICANTAHINVDECGAPERFTGCKLLSLPAKQGKITVDQILPFLDAVGFEHHVQPGVISISQATEMGTVYQRRELKKISDFAHKHGMLLHMDGARIANAAASLKTNLSAITRDVGVDVLSFGGAKNGLMYGEAVIFFDRGLARDFKYTRKQGTHLPSKMRFISAQFSALLTNDLWRRNAAHANSMARLLARELAKIPLIEITQKVESNGVFASLPKKYIAKLQKQSFFYVWNEQISEVRFMTSFDTTQEDISEFVALIKKTLR